MIAGAVISLLAIALFPRESYSEVPPVVEVKAEIITNEVIVPQTVEEKVSYYADKYKVDQKLAHFIAKAESGYKKDIVGDMKIICARTGKPVRSRGVFQITECYHPNVSDEQAFDPDFNIEYGMKLIAQGPSVCKSQFSTCRAYYNYNSIK